VKYVYALVLGALIAAGATFLIASDVEHAALAAIECVAICGVFFLIMSLMKKLNLPVLEISPYLVAVAAAIVVSYVSYSVGVV
jgi:hypothetical protein